METTDTKPPASHDTSTTTATMSTSIKKAQYTKWTRLNYKGIHHDNRRLLKHRAKNCECSICYREIFKLPPKETQQEHFASIKNQVEEREMKKGKRMTKKDIKAGKQGIMEQFFGPLR